MGANVGAMWDWDGRNAMNDMPFPISLTLFMICVCVGQCRPPLLNFDVNCISDVTSGKLKSSLSTQNVGSG